LSAYNYSSAASCIHSQRASGSSPDSTEQSTVALLLQGLDGLLGQSDTILLELVKAGVQVDEREVQTQALGQSLEDLPSSRNDLTANAVTREQTCDKVSLRA
jgi:hypothetical protein